MKLTSELAIISIKRDRAKLAKHFSSKPNTGPCPDNLKIPVTITGFITGVWGHNDGIDQEFEVEVTSLNHSSLLERSPYELGVEYRAQNGDVVVFVEVANADTPYETMACAAGIHRYTRRDFGRVTGSPHDYSDPRNVPVPSKPDGGRRWQEVI